MAASPFVANLLAFLRGLRRMGFSVGPGEARLVLLALQHTGIEDPAVVRDAVQAVVVKRAHEVALFRAAWRVFFQNARGVRDAWLALNTLSAQVARRWQTGREVPQVVWLGRGRDERAAPPPDETAGSPWVWMKTGASGDERLRHRDAAAMTPAEWDQVRRWRARVRPLWRPTRRTLPVHRGGRLDLARTLRKAAAGTGGEPIEWIFRKTRRKQRPVVLVCDVSGSMDPYSRMALRFAHALLAAGMRVDVYVFSTRLTRITPALRLRDPDRALQEAVWAAPDMSGGTRLAEALAAFRQVHAPRALRDGATVVLLSDGLDAGEPEALETEITRLRRLARRLVWWNPLLGDPGYRPTARGAAVLARQVDAAHPAHAWASLEAAWTALVDGGRLAGRHQQQ
ncbi:VWA domain-containing protein [Alicyclobacillus sp.]|uniref:vWA domain-containing protein n=1 Tax=Alicyclobacillus sp. TaxID=61169 RepID=UPI0025C1E4BA|nr:VWA domain-containing protein [Alicyclobacillus sp.]MCL6515888.1 VWA domain-containing protein [Alicyclobacillus sp.]